MIIWHLGQQRNASRQRSQHVSTLSFVHAERIVNADQLHPRTQYGPRRQGIRCHALNHDLAILGRDNLFFFLVVIVVSLDRSVVNDGAWFGAAGSIGGLLRHQQTHRRGLDFLFDHGRHVRSGRWKVLFRGGCWGRIRQNGR